MIDCESGGGGGGGAGGGNAPLASKELVFADGVKLVSLFSTSWHPCKSDTEKPLQPVAELHAAAHSSTVSPWPCEEPSQ